MTFEAIERRRRLKVAQEQKQGLRRHMEPGQWQEWLREHFKAVASSPMAPDGRHARLWNWFEGLTPGVRPRPHGEYWPRGGAKSSTAELAATRLGERGNRRFVLYVSGTQGQANKHVQAIASNFESLGYGRAVNRYGNSKGWKVDLLRVDNGFNVLALGLDAAARGIKLDNFRPDLIILDDVDERHDKPEAVAKKIATITESILPAGSSDCAILFVQNLIHSNSIASQLEKGTADFLLDREQTPAEPAIIGLKYETFIGENGLTNYRITEGRASWAGQSRETCEKQLNDWGRAAFMREAQHETDEIEDGLWQRERDIEPFRYRVVGDKQIEVKVDHKRNKWERVTISQWLRIGVGVDPSWASKGDEAGILSGAIAQWRGQTHGFVFADKSTRASAGVWAQTAVSEYHERKADVFAAEGNFMGEMVKSTVATVPGAPPVKIIHVSRGKLIRAEPIQKLCEDGRIHFPVTGTEECERQCCTYKPGDESPGRMDALVILMSELLLAEAPAPRKSYGF